MVTYQPPKSNLPCILCIPPSTSTRLSIFLAGFIFAEKSNRKFGIWGQRARKNDRNRVSTFYLGSSYPSQFSWLEGRPFLRGDGIAVFLICNLDAGTSLDLGQLKGSNERSPHILKVGMLPSPLYIQTLFGKWYVAFHEAPIPPTPLLKSHALFDF